MKEKRWQPWILLSPSLSAIFFFMVVPIGFIIVYSFWIRASTGADIPAFQLGNYKKFFEDFFYSGMLLRSLRISLETVLLCVVFGYIPAYFFYQTRSKFKALLMLLLMLPFWISYIIRTLSWINILGESGLCDYSLNCYTGCAHACAYCYARFMGRFHHPGEAWGNFVDVKTNAPEVLARQLGGKKLFSPGSVFVSSVLSSRISLVLKMECGGAGAATAGIVKEVAQTMNSEMAMKVLRFVIF